MRMHEKTSTHGLVERASSGTLPPVFVMNTYYTGIGIGRNLRALLLSPWTKQKLGAFIARQSRADLLALTALIESGAITPALDRAYPLGQAAAALRHLAGGHARGKVVISI